MLKKCKSDQNRFKNFTILDCFTKQSASGNNLPDRFTGLSPNDCQTKCQELDECAYFMLIQNTCYMKKQSAIHGIKDNNNAVWGPKFCEGNVVGFNLNIFSDISSILSK